MARLQAETAREQARLEEAARLQEEAARLQEEKTGLEQRLEAAEGSGWVQPQECLCCLRAPRDALYLPCGHLATCIACTELLVRQGRPCPACNGQVLQVLRVFIP